LGYFQAEGVAMREKMINMGALTFSVLMTAAFLKLYLFY